MKSVLLLCGLAFLCVANAFPTIALAGIDCGNGLSCAPEQTCMSNTTGAGKVVRKVNVLNIRLALCHAYRHYTVCLLPSPQRSAVQRRARILPRLLHLLRRLQMLGL
jgi:hypothetical protein